MINKTLVAVSDQVSADLQGESVILNLKTGRYYGLDPVGARVWELLQKPITFQHLKGTLLDEFEVDEHTCEQDLLELLQQLVDVELVEVVDAPGD